MLSTVLRCGIRQNVAIERHKEIRRVCKHGIRHLDPQGLEDSRCPRWTTFTGNPQRAKRSFAGVTAITQGKRIATT